MTIARHSWGKHMKMVVNAWLGAMLHCRRAGYAAAAVHLAVGQGMDAALTKFGLNPWLRL